MATICTRPDEYDLEHGSGEEDVAFYVDSMATPPRALVEMDVDQESLDGVHRLIRYKTTRYEAHKQRAHVHFLYDRFETRPDDEQARRYISDFESHVYFPRELQLLFLHTGFAIQHTWGGYRGEPLRSHSPALIMAGKKPGARGDHPPSLHVNSTT